MTKRHSLILIFILSSIFSFAQPQNWNWYFGTGAAVNFSSGNPVAVAGCILNTVEGCASVSDASGNLLFYTDGITAYNRNNVVMPNGSGLFGNSSSTESGIIVPKPGSTTLYYIFTSDCAGGNGINYYVVDMTLNAGLGALVSNTATNILTNSTEKLTAVRHCNGVDYWVIVHGENNNTYYSFLVSSTGVAAPVVSNAGTVYIGTLGYLKASPSGRKLAAAIFEQNLVDVLDFDNSTGVVSFSNPITLTVPPEYAYGVSFSPNNNVLYEVGDAGNPSLNQFDLTSNVQATIQASQYQVCMLGTSGGALQIGPNGKMYVCRYSSNFLDVINTPNVLGVGCGYVANAVNLGAGMCMIGLPNWMDAINADTVSTSLPSDTTVCSGPIILKVDSGATSYLWSTGATIDSISVNASGIYWVQVTGGTTCNPSLHTDSITVTFVAPIAVNLGNDTNLCTGQNLTINAGNAGALFSWSNGATTQTINVTTTGSYSVTVTAGTCSDIDTINVTFTNAPVVNLGNDISVCVGQPVTLGAGNIGSTYLWSTGATTQTISPTTTGNYWVVASIGTCSDRDTISVTFNALPVVNLGPDQTICNGQTVTLNAGAGTSYLWSDGSTTQTITVTTTNSYWVVVQNGTCAGTDTMNVITVSAPTVNIGPDIKLCYGLDTGLNAGNPGFNYLWSTGETAQHIAINATGTYWVKVSNFGCIGFDTALVSISKPVIVLLYDTVVCPGEPITISIEKGFKTYAWSPGGQGTYMISTDKPGTYYVSVTDTNNCPGSASIFIDEFCPSDLYIPTAFSPNGNGINDYFLTYGERIISFHLYIYNRWGEIIFESQDMSEGWNGKYNGEDAQQGSYVYRVDYQLYDYKELKKHTKYGVVNLMR